MSGWHSTGGQTRAGFYEATPWWPSAAHASQTAQSASRPRRQQEPRQEHMQAYGRQQPRQHSGWTHNDGRGGFGQTRTQDSSQYSFSERWRPEPRVKWTGPVDQLYADWLKAHRLTFHRQGVRDKAVERSDAMQAQLEKLRGQAELAKADVLAREHAVQQAQEEESKLVCSLKNARGAQRSTTKTTTWARASIGTLAGMRMAVRRRGPSARRPGTDSRTVPTR